MFSEKEKISRFALSRVRGIGPSGFLKIIESGVSAYDFFQLPHNDHKKLLNEKIADNIREFKKDFEIDVEISKLNKLGIHFVVLGDDNYPEALATISNPPICLYYKGEWENINFAKCISIIGSRNMSGYGKSVINKLVSQLVQNEFVIVSGMAFGVDREAHIQTINNNGKTIAVLASDPSNPTPIQNTDVYNRIFEGGGLILSESYINEEINQGAFPRRNRIICGLSSATVVIEAGPKSGAVLTANIAFSEGRQVFAVPGNVGQVTSNGTNYLIKTSKAKLIESAEDILNELGYIAKLNSDIKIYDSINPENEFQAKIIEILKYEASTIDKIAETSGLTVGEVNREISFLELNGNVMKKTDGKCELKA